LLSLPEGEAPLYGPLITPCHLHITLPPPPPPKPNSSRSPRCSPPPPTPPLLYQPLCSFFALLTTPHTTYVFTPPLLPIFPLPPTSPLSILLPHPFPHSLPVPHPPTLLNFSFFKSRNRRPPNNELQNVPQTGQLRSPVFPLFFILP